MRWRSIGPFRGGRTRRSGADTLAGIGGSLTSLVPILQGADAAPTTQVLSAVTERRAALATLLGKWKAASTTELAALNAALVQAGQPAIVAK